MATKKEEGKTQPPLEGENKPKKDKGMFQDKEGRLIIRNLQFDIKQKHLKQTFSKFGNIIDVSVPLNPENNLNKGFGFVEFKAREDARKAIEALNGKNYKGRMIAVDFAMSKRQYNRKIDDIIEKNPIKNKKKLKEAEAKAKKDDDADSWSGDETPEEEAEEKPQKAMRDFKKKDENEDNDATSTDKNEKKRTVKNRKKYDNDVKEGLTLFVRNIDYSTTETELREFFEDFGKVYFVRLVKSRDNPDAHKGSAFVKFVDPEPVEKLAKISDEYWSKEKHTASKAVVNDLEMQLEFKGRRLVMFKAESKEERNKSKAKQEVKVDKRNIDYVKVGLINTKDFINGPVSDSDMEIRIRLWKEKQNSIKKNPNLFVSKTRMCIRHLLRSMDEKNLAQFCSAFVQNWKDSLNVKEKKAANQKKLVHQYKILKDKEKTDAEGNAKSSGIGFIEVEDPDLAIYMINHMNNFVLNEKKPKGIILDFALEDHRKLLKRKQKLESFQKKQREAKAEKDKEENKKKKREKKEKGKEKEKKEDNKPTIDDIEDIEKLRELMKATNSRGKRNRIKRKIQRLKGEVPTEPRNSDHKQEKKKDTEKVDKKEKKEKKEKGDKEDKKKTKEETEPEPQNDNSELESLNDEDDEFKGIELSKNTKALLKKRAKTEDELIEDQIKQDMKRKKRKRKQKQKEEDELDDVMKTFEERINKKLKKIEEAGDEVHNSDQGFDDVEIQEN